MQVKEMLKNNLYVHGPKDVFLPAKLHVGDFLLQRMWACGEKIAWINAATNETLSYRQISQESINLALVLTHLGVRKGQTVGICSENRREFWSVIIGGSCAGAIVTTINPGYGESEVRHALKISKPKIIFCSPLIYKTHGQTFKSINHIKYVVVFGDERPSGTLLFKELVTPDNKGNNHDVIVNNRLTRNVSYEEFEAVDVQGQIDTAFILYSSGTTGLPKGVMQTHMNILSICCAPISTDVNQTSLSIAPWYHTMGFVGGLASLGYGRMTVYLAKFEVDLYLRTIEKYKISQLSVVPPVLVAVCKSPIKYDLSSVELIYSGAAPLHKDTIGIVQTKFPNIKAVLQGYGMTETAHAVTRTIYTEAALCDLGSVGRVNSSAIIKVADTETRKPLGPNRPGEICVKGPMVMKGYVGKDRSEDFDDEGFLKTGDIGYYTEDKQFFIVDRLKELIKYKAFQVAPAEIEALLLKHEAVKDAGIVGVPDKTSGEVPIAFVVKLPGVDVTEEELKQFVAERLSNPKHLRGGVRFVDTIPKNPSGKIIRKTLKEMAKSRTSKL